MTSQGALKMCVASLLCEDAPGVNKQNGPSGFVPFAPFGAAKPVGWLHTPPLRLLFGEGPLLQKFLPKGGYGFVSHNGWRPFALNEESLQPQFQQADFEGSQRLWSMAQPR
jgi:hypothetical protein